MNDNQILGIIHRSFTGEITPEEKTILTTWQNESAENKAEYDALQQTWEHSLQFGEEYQPNIEEGWAKFHYRISKETPVRKLNYRWAWSAAAVLLIAVGLTWVMDPFHWKGTDAIAYQTDADEHLMVKLPDQSVVVLGPASTLSLTEDFGKQSRTLVLEGSADFDVQSDSEKPFIVKTGNSTTKVLGTRFRLQPNQKSGQILIAVQEGKVEFKSEKGAKTLTPGQMAQLNTKTSEIKVSRFSIDDPLWNPAGEIIIFDDAPLSNVINYFKSYFDAEIKTGTTFIKDCEFDSSFSNPSLEEVMEVLKASFQIDVKQLEEGTFLLENGNCPDNG